MIRWKIISIRDMRKVKISIKMTEKKTITYCLGVLFCACSLKWLDKCSNVMGTHNKAQNLSFFSFFYLSYPWKNYGFRMGLEFICSDIKMFMLVFCKLKKRKIRKLVDMDRRSYSLDLLLKRKSDTWNIDWLVEGSWKG